MRQRSGMLVAVVVVAAVAAGCGKKKDKPAPSVSPGATSGSGAGASASPVAGGETPLPTIDLSPVKAARTREARKLNSAGLELHRAKDYSAAKAKFSAAVRSDPGYIIARYNLACAHNLAGEGDRALSLLGEIKAAGCPTCLGRLVRAREDADWTSQWNTPAFDALTKDVVIEQGKLRDLAKTFAATLAAAGPDLAKLDPLLDERRRVKVLWSCGTCDEESKPEQLEGAAAVKSWLGQHLSMGIMNQPDKITCGKDCCSFDFEASEIGDFMPVLHEVCFSTDSGDVRTVSSFTGGSI